MLAGSVSRSWDRTIVSPAVGRRGKLLVFASAQGKDDPVLVGKAVTQNGDSLRWASNRLKNDKELVLAAVNQKGSALKHTSVQIKDDEVIVKQALSRDGMSLQFASGRLKDSTEMVLLAVTHNPNYLESSSEKWRDNKQVVQAALRVDGTCLRHASKSLRGDKECVLIAVQNSPASLKFAMDGLNQHPECLVASGIWDNARMEKESKRPNIILSTRFSLGEKSTSTATDFTVLLKKHQNINQIWNFVVYSPNAFSKQTCDPNWTDKSWPCRGTFSTCKMDIKYKTNDPTDASCWRYSFRSKLEKAKRSEKPPLYRGCMIQVVEYVGYRHEMGKGQEIELQMAEEVGIKVFQIQQPTIRGGSRMPKADPFKSQNIDELVEQLKEWYTGSCEDMRLVRVHCSSKTSELYIEYSHGYNEQ